MTRRTACLGAAALPLLTAAGQPLRTVSVRDHGAAGDGRTLDTSAINRAILAASRVGGGTVRFPRGRYLSFSIRLASDITLLLEAGAVIEAADPKIHAGAYDPPEDSPDLYQDFGHSHWHNSLIWGVGVRNVGIVGPGMIDGKGLTRHGPGARWSKGTGERPLSMRQMPAHDIAVLEPARTAMIGQGNKAIALKNASNVTLRDFTVLKGGHFAILLTGVDDVTIDGLRIDTDRDGIDLDCVRRARVTNCRVNSPNDDAIVLKSSYALGEARACEDVRVSRCSVSGWDMGSMLDGSFRRTQEIAPDRDRVTGRIKFGTESNGGFRNIRIDDCTFARCRGLALETVDGGVMEDVVATNLRMREVTTAPLFLRLGDRRRGPDGTGVGTIRGLTIEGVEANGIDHRYPATIAGLIDHPIEDVTLRDIHLVYAGGGTAEDAARVPPEIPDAYPEPSMFGTLPAWGLWMRHARGVRLDEVRLETATPDARPPIIAVDTHDVTARRTPLWT